jgi:hypothetical protein
MSQRQRGQHVQLSVGIVGIMATSMNHVRPYVPAGADIMMLQEHMRVFQVELTPIVRLCWTRLACPAQVCWIEATAHQRGNAIPDATGGKLMHMKSVPAVQIIPQMLDPLMGLQGVPARAMNLRLLIPVQDQ